MNIKTNYYMKPIPIRSYDWEAVDDDTYDVDGPIGFGATEAGAIADLKEQLPCSEDDEEPYYHNGVKYTREDEDWFFGMDGKP